MCPQRIFGLAIVVLVTLGGRVASYTNQWAVHIEGGPEVAQQVAQEHGFQYLDKVGTLSAFFVFFFLSLGILTQRHAFLVNLSSLFYSNFAIGVNSHGPLAAFVN